jgi:hypothetical protein
MENLNSLKSSSKIKINSNLKKIKTQIIPINKKSFLPISKMNIKNKINISNSNYETSIKPNTTTKLEVNNDIQYKRVLTPNKIRFSHHAINCQTPIKNNHKKQLSINNIIGRIYSNNYKGFRKFNFEKIRNKTSNNSNQNSINEIFHQPQPKSNLINEGNSYFIAGEQLKIVHSLKKELKLKNDENIKLRNELSKLNKENLGILEYNKLNGMEIENNLINQINKTCLRKEEKKENIQINDINKSLLEHQKKMINDLNSINEQLKNENKLLKKKNYNSNDLTKEIGKLKKIIEANTQSYEENQKTLGEKLIQLEEENQKLKKFENQTNLYKKENKELKEKLEEYNKNLNKLLESNNILEEDKQDNKVLKKKFNFEQLEKEIKELKEKIKAKNQNINTIKNLEINSNEILIESCKKKQELFSFRIEPINYQGQEKRNINEKCSIEEFNIRNKYNVNLQIENQEQFSFLTIYNKNIKFFQIENTKSFHILIDNQGLEKKLEEIIIKEKKEKKKEDNENNLEDVKIEEKLRGKNIYENVKGKEEDERIEEKKEEDEIEMTESMENEVKKFVNDTFKSIIEIKKMNI